MIAPFFEELSNEYHHVIFLKVDVDAVEVSSEQKRTLAPAEMLLSLGLIHSIRILAAFSSLKKVPTIAPLHRVVPFGLPGLALIWCCCPAKRASCFKIGTSSPFQAVHKFDLDGSSPCSPFPSILW